MNIEEQLNKCLPYAVGETVFYIRKLTGTTKDCTIVEECEVAYYENKHNSWRITIKSKNGLYGVYVIPISEIDNCIFKTRESAENFLSKE